MTDHAFYILWSEALTSTDRDTYISELATSSLILDPDSEEDIPAEVIDHICAIWDAAHMSVADIRRTAGLNQAGFAERFCLSRRTLEGWESRGTCPDYVRLMMAECLGLIKR